jgi:anti-anti-sigma regulatory factor
MGNAVNISSRTPEGRPNHCPVCGFDLQIEPSDPAGDAPCPQCGHLLWFVWEELGDAQVIKLAASPFDAESWDSLIDSTDVSSGRRLVIDFSDVQNCSSAILGKLINLKKKLGRERRLVLQHVHPDFLEVFRITRLDQVVELEPRVIWNFSSINHR